MNTTTKRITDFRITWTADHEQYYQGHSTMFTDYTHTATGCGETLIEAFEDALDTLYQGDSESFGKMLSAIEPNILAELTSQVKEPEMLDWDVVKGYCEGLNADVIYPNESDYCTGFWKHNYKLSLCAVGTQTFIVNADCEQDALDEVIDYCEEHLPGLVMPREEEPENEDEREGYVQGGNHGRLLNVPNEELMIEQDGGHDCAVCAGEWHYYVNVDVKIEERGEQ